MVLQTQVMTLMALETKVALLMQTLMPLETQEVALLMQTLISQETQEALWLGCHPDLRPGPRGPH